MGARVQALSEAAQSMASAVASTSLGQGIGEAALELSNDLTELSGRTHEQARAIGSSLWQLTQDLQDAAKKAVAEESIPRQSDDSTSGTNLWSSISNIIGTTASTASTSLSRLSAHTKDDTLDVPHDNTASALNTEAASVASPTSAPTSSTPSITTAGFM